MHKTNSPQALDVECMLAGNQRSEEDVLRYDVIEVVHLLLNGLAFDHVSLRVFQEPYVRFRYEHAGVEMI